MISPKLSHFLSWHRPLRSKLWTYRFLKAQQLRGKRRWGTWQAYGETSFYQLYNGPIRGTSDRCRILLGLLPSRMTHPTSVVGYVRVFRPSLFSTVVEEEVVSGGEEKRGRPTFHKSGIEEALSGWEEDVSNTVTLADIVALSHANVRITPEEVVRLSVPDQNGSTLRVLVVWKDWP